MSSKRTFAFKETVPIQLVHILANAKQDTDQEQTVQPVSVSNFDLSLSFFVDTIFTILCFSKL